MSALSGRSGPAIGALMTDADGGWRVLLRIQAPAPTTAEHQDALLLTLGVLNTALAVGAAGLIGGLTALAVGATAVVTAVIGDLVLRCFLKPFSFTMTTGNSRALRSM